MPANDERDPLDTWLNQQVQPLPPPPGTFELITRRARRRKLRKLAVSVAGAAAVAVAIAVAVPGGLLLHLSTPRVNGSVAAGESSSPGKPGTQSPQGTGSVSPSPSSTGPAFAPVTEPSGPVPRNFQPTSVTFVSPDIGWVIGQAGTPGQCANKVNPSICTSVARTDNAGQTWQGGPAPETTGPKGPNGVSQIRFLNGIDGWAYGPELWATHDAGNTWHQVQTNGQRVTALETAGQRAFALWADCGGSDSAGIAAGCTSYTLMTAAHDSDQWTAVGDATTGLTDQGNQASGMIALTGSAGYLLAPDGTLYSGPLDGSAWHRAGAAPCKPGTAQASGIPGQGFLALVDSTHLLFACAATAGNGAPQIYGSGDGGAVWTAQPPGSWSFVQAPGQLTSLAAAPNGAAVLATDSGLYVLPTGTSTWKATNATGSGAPANGFSYVGMTTNDQGVAVPADTSLHEIWMTFDGGLHWTARTPITPGN